MSKTGGGPGTNQHRVKGVGKSEPRRPPADVDLATTGASNWEPLLAAYPSPPDDVNGIPDPTWDDLSHLVGHIEPKGAERALLRLQARNADAIFNDARLEGISYTQPEIVELIGGTHVPGHTIGEEAQVFDMQRALRYLSLVVLDGPLEPSQAVSDDFHVMIAASLGLKSTAFRGDQRAQYFGPRVKLDRGEFFRALDARLTHAVLDQGLRRIQKIAHPVLRAATWAAFSAYEQFYLDGNKRTGRYVMNAVLISHGYDAILVPAAQKPVYDDEIVAALRSGDLTNHIRFLISLYRDR